MKIWPGQPYPLGAIYDGTGVNFALFSEVAERVELCLFDDQGIETRIDLPEVTSFCWHGYLPNIQPGQRYGFRVHGPYAPEKGHRCNPTKFLLDPYARAVEGQVLWDESVFPYRFADPEGSVNKLDSARFMPKSVVVNPYFDWGTDRPPKTPWHMTVIYEMHVKGFSMLHPDIPRESRGTYAGISHPAAIEYLTKLGVTAIELMPVHQFVHDNHLLDRGLRNYWGYNSIGYLAPHNEYSSGGQLGQQVQEFRQMVKALHNAGIEVILDVVYNHTAEGNHLGPVLSMKGIDNAAYYRLMPNDPRYYMDYTGTGNSLNVRHPQVLQLIMDSLRYWVKEMHVDGFRFDLAAALARELHEVDRLSAFFDLIHQDPVVGQVKLIAEPWDIGEGGYQVGNFPPNWSEWNGKYRDTVRDYWRGTDRTLGEFAYRFTGSSDLYATNGRKPFASINFVTAHDGFTLQDLVSYNEKHNEANGEGNRDGDNNNRSWNCGAEGPAKNIEINALRLKQKRNMLTTLLLSQGIPMLLGGDEFGRTQRGNNNAYCQDNKISWYNWRKMDAGLLQFVTSLIRLRREHPIFRRRRYFLGRPIHGIDVGDIGWYRPDGKEMTDEDWNIGFAKSLGVFLNGKGILSLDARGEQLVDDSFYLIFNAHYEPLSFTLPQLPAVSVWAKILDTSDDLPTSKLSADSGGQMDAWEERRLEELRQYFILDTGSDPVFDDFAALASQLCNAPVAFISFIDHERQWLKAKLGISMDELPRDGLLDAFRESEDDLVEVSDLRTDPRYATFLQGISGMNPRFLVASPLRSSAGDPIGVLAVLDKEPRQLSENQRDALKTLSRRIMHELEVRRELRESQATANRSALPAIAGSMYTSITGTGRRYAASATVRAEARTMILLQHVK